MSERPPLLEIRDLVKHFRVDAFLRRTEPIRAVDGVSFAVGEGEIFAIVGESGSGKTTLTRIVLGLERPTAGAVLFEGRDIWQATRGHRASLRRAIQPVFQDPTSSLDPHWPVGRTIREALDAQRIGTRKEREQRVLELLDQVGLSSRVLRRRPHELSGGQKQRVCIAAALAPKPRLLVADEPVTALDVSVQAQVLNLLHEIQRDSGLTILLVAHDLSLVGHLSDRVVVIYRGHAVEEGPVAQVLDNPVHPYTKTLVAAAPTLIST
jgi:ABC-type glutathione transport system ATPase component